MDIIEKVRICGYSNKFFMELKFSTKSVSVKMYAQQVRIETGWYQKQKFKAIGGIRLTKGSVFNKEIQKDPCVYCCSSSHSFKLS